MIARLIAILFLSREVAHREHLSTTSFSQHMALGTFYDEIIENADAIAEAYQGRHGLIGKIPMLTETDADSDNADRTKPQNEIISELPTWANSCVTAWNEAKAIREAAIASQAQAAKDQPVTTGV